MGLQMSKFLNTTTHFSKSSFGWKDSSDLSIPFARSDNFLAMYGPLSGAEADVRQPVSEDIRVVGSIVHVITNTLDGATTIAVRDDGGDISELGSIGAGVTGVIIITYPTKPIILQGSLVATNIRTGGTVGAIAIRTVQIIYERVLN